MDDGIQSRPEEEEEEQNTTTLTTPAATPKQRYAASKAAQLLSAFYWRRHFSLLEREQRGADAVREEEGEEGEEECSSSTGKGSKRKSGRRTRPVDVVAVSPGSLPFLRSFLSFFPFPPFCRSSEDALPFFRSCHTHLAPLLSFYLVSTPKFLLTSSSSRRRRRPAPGFVPATNLSRDSNWFVRWLMRHVVGWFPFAVSVEEGAWPLFPAVLSFLPFMSPPAARATDSQSARPFPLAIGGSPTRDLIGGKGRGKKCAAPARNAMGTSSGLSAYTFPLFFLVPFFFPLLPHLTHHHYPKSRRSKDCEIFTDDVNYRLLLLLLLLPE